MFAVHKSAIKLQNLGLHRLYFACNDHSRGWNYSLGSFFNTYQNLTGRVW